MSEEFKYKTSSDSRKKKSFVPRIVHILLAIIVIVVLSILIFTNADFNKGRDYTHLRYSKMKNEPIQKEDLLNLFSANYNDQNILITVQDVVIEEGKTYMIYDLKCDFVPVQSNCRCEVDLINNTFDFLQTETPKSKIPLGTGKLLRTTAGKVIFKTNSGKIDYIQL
ncbi:MAG: hypothetical protein IKQ46_12955 [Bacteroidales bacterium]|jgi:hypothetical protein|nr:hypothetical protein [Bacteroidales bacterium]